MTATTAVTLPVLPLQAGVVLPQLVVTIALETDEARAAASTARARGTHLLLVPRLEGRFASVGTIAAIETAGELPNGRRALVVRGLQRARIASLVSGPDGEAHTDNETDDDTQWAEVEPVTDAPPTAHV